jgi:hypothetical protein
MRSKASVKYISFTNNGKTDIIPVNPKGKPSKAGPRVQTPRSSGSLADLSPEQDFFPLTAPPAAEPRILPASEPVAATLIDPVDPTLFPNENDRDPFDFTLPGLFGDPPIGIDPWGDPGFGGGAEMPLPDATFWMFPNTWD